MVSRLGSIAIWMQKCWENHKCRLLKSFLLGFSIEHFNNQQPRALDKGYIWVSALQFIFFRPEWSQIKLCINYNLHAGISWIFKGWPLVKLLWVEHLEWAYLLQTSISSTHLSWSIDFFRQWKFLNDQVWITFRSNQTTIDYVGISLITVNILLEVRKVFHYKEINHDLFWSSLRS